MRVIKCIDKLPCFTRLQKGQLLLHRGRVTNRCFTDAEVSLRSQGTLRPKPMTQEEVSFVRRETGAKPFLETKWIHQ